METFEQRVEAFNAGIMDLQKQHNVVLYAANVVLKNGEVAPMVRVADATDPSIVKAKEKAYENKAKGRSSAGEKA